MCFIGNIEGVEALNKKLLGAYKLSKGIQAILISETVTELSLNFQEMLRAFDVTQNQIAHLLHKMLTQCASGLSKRQK